MQRQVFMNPVTGKILQILVRRTGFVSGEELCHELQMTRSAVWKHVVQLRQCGYRINAVTGKGYRLAELTGMPVSGEVAPLLTTSRFGRNHVFLDSTVSTNLVARAMAREGEHEGSIVVADHQSGGRGRMGRRWISPPGVNLYCSLLLRPAVPSRRVPEIPLLAAAAIHQALSREFPGLQSSIKWPNDILVNGRKVCGILCEMESEPDMTHFVVVGFGLNVNLAVIPEELQGTATSIFQETGRPASRSNLLAEILNGFEPVYEEWLAHDDLGSAVAYLEEHSWLKNKTVCIEQVNRRFSGRVCGFGREGQLLLEAEDGTRLSVFSGEAHLHETNNLRVSS
jgi:BirA family biotin operon repressor/biotin-[acetyl-CoA-carboxylase] ligase